MLFLLYINDLPNVSTVLNFIIFADDSLTDLVETINGELSKLADWFKANRLSLNVKKSCFMAFRACNKRILDMQGKLMIDGNPVKQVQSTKFWGFILTNA